MAPRTAAQVNDWTTVPADDWQPVAEISAAPAPAAQPQQSTPAPSGGFHPLDALAQWGQDKFKHLNPEDMAGEERQGFGMFGPHVDRFVANAATATARGLTAIPAGIADWVGKNGVMGPLTPRQSAERMTENAQGTEKFDPKKPVTAADVSDYAAEKTGGIAAGIIFGQIAGGILKGFSSNPAKGVGKLAFAAGKDTTQAIEATQKDLATAAAAKGHPNTVGGFLDTVNYAKDTLGQEFKQTLGSTANRKFDASPIADRIENLVTPNMAMTKDGLATIKAIYAAAQEFRKPWTIGELDAERMKRYADLGSYNKQLPVARYAARTGSTNVAIDNAVNQAIKENVYPVMDQAAGKPAGYFENLQARRSNLIHLQNALDKQTRVLHDTATRTKAAPRFSRGDIAATAMGSPHSILRTAIDAVHTTDVEAQANTAVKKGFKASRVRSLPAKALMTGIGIDAAQPAPRRNASDKWSDPNQPQ